MSSAKSDESWRETLINKVKTLISFLHSNHNYKLQISDGRGKTVLHMAAAFGRKDLCIWLITKAEASINCGDYESGYTPLHAALFYGHVDVAVKLIEVYIMF